MTIEMKIFFALFIFTIYLPFANSRPITEEEILAVEELVKENLKDPDSVKFYHGDYPYPDKTGIYCGYMNAKNSFGAFTGKQLFSNFVVRNNDGIIVAPTMDFNKLTGEQYDQDIISSNCASAGYDIPVKNKFLKQVNKKRSSEGILNLSNNYVRE
ncbi:hypothetical protein [Symbiopectobacterium purcellii]|uniref:hypothetical protein n=1 Tax=Symbiopectobacterium purcellii TaxID=2871826 RepID=UPI003F85EBC5